LDFGRQYADAIGNVSGQRKRPIHLLLIPTIQPWIGSRYHDERSAVLDVVDRRNCALEHHGPVIRGQFLLRRDERKLLAVHVPPLNRHHRILVDRFGFAVSVHSFPEDTTEASLTSSTFASAVAAKRLFAAGFQLVELQRR
jgi:hypothetical protein